MSGSADQSPPGAIKRIRLAALGDRSESEREDVVAVEEPLEIRIVAEFDGARTSRSFSITMRSPGHDYELAAGFLLAEGIVTRRGDIWRISRCQESAPDHSNIVEVHLEPGATVDLEQLGRNVYVHASCGVCGKESIEALRRLGGKAPEGDLVVDAQVVRDLPEKLLEAQDVFSRTGGLHACGAFSGEGASLLVREDVGRHNAVDKVVGRLLMDDRLPGRDIVFVVSGRTSFELVHKTMAAGVSILVAVGAPSSLAIETAREFGMTLVGFVRKDRFNVYCGRRRIANG